MGYLTYLLCLALMLPAFATAALVAFVVLFAAGPRSGWSVIIDALAFIGSGIAEPLRYGWRIVLIFAVLGLFLSAGAFGSLRTPAFYGLAILGILCSLFSIYYAFQPENFQPYVLLPLSPSFLGIALCFWFATHMKK